MYEFHVMNKVTGERDVFFGYNAKDMARRFPQYNPKTYTITNVTYDEPEVDYE